MLQTLYNLHPYLWYIAGSICFVVGTGILMYRIIKGIIKAH